MFFSSSTIEEAFEQRSTYCNMLVHCEAELVDQSITLSGALQYNGRSSPVDVCKFLTDCNLRVYYIAAAFFLHCSMNHAGCWQTTQVADGARFSLIAAAASPRSQGEMRRKRGRNSPQPLLQHQPTPGNQLLTDASVLQWTQHCNSMQTCAHRGCVFRRTAEPVGGVWVLPSCTN